MTTENKILTHSRVTSVRSSLLVGALTSVVFLGGFSAWAVSVPLAGAIIAQGSVVTDGSVQVVRHERGGVLSSLLVREGQQVHAGQVLATLSRSDDQAAAEELTMRLAALVAKEARLAAELSQADAFDAGQVLLPDLLADLGQERMMPLVDDQVQEFTSRRRQQLDTAEVLQAQRRALADQRAGTEGELNALRSQQASLAQDISLRRDAIAQGFGRESLLRELERSQDALTGNIEKATALLSSLAHQISEIDSRLTAERSTFQQKVADELSKVRADKFEAMEALLGKQKAVARIDVRAPVDGIVNKLHVNTVGSAVEPFSPMIELVAEEQPLLIEARVHPADIDDIYPEQQARVVMSAFNRRLYDPVSAKVTFVASDARQDRADQEPYYTVRLVVDPADRQALPKILPGMPSEVYLTTHERTFADYIAEPFIQSFQRSFRQ
jgi:HlyD family type I secretion membrane fusion protein